ncbi:ATP-binding cassette domain-containing protein [soil metagenome]
MAEPILELRDVSKRFTRHVDVVGRFVRRLGARIDPEVVHAVDHVSLTVHRGEVVGLVGESGCGKSTLGRLAVGLLDPTEGERLMFGEEVNALKTRQTKAAARREMIKIQMIFQDPYASLNPRMRVRDIVGEAPVAHGLIDAKQRDDYVEELLRTVGLDPMVARRFPHQFSGGQRARVGIARALAVKPEFLVCDEAVAALDVSIQAQVLNLFIELRNRLDLTYLFISHDLGVVRHLSDRVVIMYLGRIVESAPADEVFAKPNHPYTQALLAEAPTLDVRKKTFVAIKGELPSPLNPPSGCHFHPRCPHVMPVCRTQAPPLETIATGWQSACHLNTAG